MTATRKARPYFLLVTRESAVDHFAPQFGDYDRATVIQEMSDEYARHHKKSDMKVLNVISAKRADIEDALATLNS